MLTLKLPFGKAGLPQSLSEAATGKRKWWRRTLAQSSLTEKFREEKLPCTWQGRNCREMSISLLPPDRDTYCQSKHHNYINNTAWKIPREGRAEGMRIKKKTCEFGEARTFKWKGHKKCLTVKIHSSTNRKQQEPGQKCWLISLKNESTLWSTMERKCSNSRHQLRWMFHFISSIWKTLIIWLWYS